MDLLTTAVVDITTLVATCHALKPAPQADAVAIGDKQRRRLRRELRRGALAYIDVLARTRHGALDDLRLEVCRRAAEREMPRAVAQQADLSRILASEEGSLDGLAAARQDLWRVAHVAAHLRSGIGTVRALCGAGDSNTAGRLARQLQRRLRKAMIAYARATLRTNEPLGKQIAPARAAALREIGKTGAAAAERISDFEADREPTQAVIRLGVTKPLFDLAIDWQLAGRDR